MVIRLPKSAVPQLALVAVLASAWMAPSAAEPPTLTVATGVDFSIGDYGQEIDTKIWYIPFSVKYRTDPVTLAVTVPYIRIDGPADVLSIDGGPIVRGDGDSMTESGLGDIVLAATYNVQNLPTRWPFVDLTIKAKLATADENEGLGTGKNDYAFQVDLAKSINLYSVFSTVGYKHLGDPPDFEFNNVIYSSIGTGYQFKPDLNGGVVYDTREAALVGSDKQQELMVYFSKKMDNKRKLLGYIVKGFTDSSPDWGIGLSISATLDLEKRPARK